MRFSEILPGYALYEDMDFCLRAGRKGPLFFCTRARLAHEHAPGGRPHWFAYGTMVTRNGWRVWRLRWPQPPRLARCRWWLISLLLAASRLFGGAPGAVPETAGRLWGCRRTLIAPPQTSKPL